MNILFNVSTKRGIVSILPLMKELGGRGHSIFTLATTHPSAGLAHPYKFMVGENANMLELLEGVAEYTIHPHNDDSADLYGMLSDISGWGIDVHVTKGDSGLARDRVLCSGIRSSFPTVRIIAQQADWHMHIQHPWFSDGFMVMGPRWGRYLVGEGVASTNIVPVGCIKGDYLRTLPRLSREYVTFFSQMTYTDEQKLAILKGLVALTNQGGVVEDRSTVIIKLHPAWEQYNVDEWGWWMNAIADTPGSSNVELRYKDDPYSLMQRSRLVVTAFSNTGYEAMIMGIPVLIVNISECPELYRDCGVDIYDVEDIKRSATNVLYGYYDTDKRDRWLHDQIYLNDGKASVRAADVIEGMDRDK